MTTSASEKPGKPVYDDNPTFVDLGLGGFLATRPDYAKYADANMGKHKVPTLRNVDLRDFDGGVKAYGHNGYFKSLEGIVHFYNTRDVKPVCPGPYTEAEAREAKCWPAPEVAQNVKHGGIGGLEVDGRGRSGHRRLFEDPVGWVRAASAQEKEVG
jgi:cytochrome c peroxidase